MASGKTGISWAQRTWQPVLGCTRLSAGCQNCYAIRDAWRFGHHPNAKIAAAYGGLVEKSPPNGRLHWTGVVRTFEDRLDEPSRWRLGYRIFVCPRADLFHPEVPWGFIWRVFDHARLAPRHAYLFLTKRPDTMRRVVDEYLTHLGPTEREEWTRANLWFGVSAEDQAAAESRIPELLAAQVPHRWVSAEPLLGPLDLRRWLGRGKVEWLVAGCESGKDARPDSIHWYSDLWADCISSDPSRNVPMFLKQMRIEGKLVKMPELSGCMLDEYPAELQ